MPIKNNTPKVIPGETFEILAGQNFTFPVRFATLRPEFVDLVIVTPAGATNPSTDLVYNRSGVPVTNGFPLTLYSSPLQLNSQNWASFNVRNTGTTSAFIFVEVSTLYY